MKQIEFERWEPDAENPRRLTYAGQRTAEDVFHELEAQLDSVGYLPDEYFTMDWRWEHGRQIPKGADFFCKTDYGGSEGIYLDVYLEWQEGDKPKKEFMDLLQLEESEFNIIQAPHKGECLYKCGNERYLLEVHAPPYKEALFGKAGGR